MRASAAAVWAAMTLGFVLTGCANHQCEYGGASRRYPGSLSFIVGATSTPGMGANGYVTTGAADATLGAFSPFAAQSYCEEDPVTYSIQFAGCTLRGSSTSQSFDTGRGASGAFIQAEGAIAPNQTCTIAFDSVQATLDVTQGTVEVTTDTLHFEITGTVASGAGLTPGAAFTLTF